MYLHLVVVLVALSQNTYRGVEGSNIAICSIIVNGEIERAISLSLSTISGTAKGIMCSPIH